MQFKVCNLKIEKDSLIIEGYINTNKGFLSNQIHFFTGNKVDTTYEEKFTSCLVDEILILGVYDAFYLNAKNEELIDAYDYGYIFPRKTHFKIKMNVKDRSLFIIATNDFYSEIFDLKKLQDNLSQSIFQ